MPPRLVLLGLLASSALAYAWPDLFGDGFDPFLASKPWLWPLIAAAMFVIGWLLPRDEVRQVADRWPAVLAGTAIQYTAMPLLAFGFGLLLAPDRDALVGILLVGCVPGAMASNVLTLLARGHVSYSVGLTTAATLLSPLVVPLAMRLTLGQVEVDFPVGRTVAELVGYVVTAGRGGPPARQAAGLVAAAGRAGRPGGRQPGDPLDHRRGRGRQPGAAGPSAAPPAGGVAGGEPAGLPGRGPGGAGRCGCRRRCGGP